MGSAIKFERTLFEPEHDLFRESYRGFLERHVAPYHEEWEKAKIVDRGVWLEAGKQGFLGMAVPEEYGGGGNPDFRYNTILVEETVAGRYSGIGFGLHNDVVAPYLLKLTSEEQKQRWLPGFCTGELITAIAMTEPGTGSDLQGIKTRAVKQGDHYVLNGSKTFITNGINSDLVIVVAQTDPDKGAQGFSLLVVERGMEGFERGRHLDKIGLDAQDTAELSFSDVKVPAENLLGQEGMGFIYLMQNLPQERINIAVMAAAAMEAVLEETLQYTKERKAFGKPIGSFQPVRAGRAGDRGHRGAHHGRRVHRTAPGRQADGRTGRHGQVVFDGEAGASDRPLPAAVRRIWLHARIPGRPCLSRCPGADDLRWHHRDHEGDHRPRFGRLAPVVLGVRSL
jgi:alkylation response protein AidB-like acyl-CoA dehydrogenase